jgi:outer membrane lipoprotein SlyB
MDKVILIGAAALLLAGCQSIQFARDQGGGCYAGTLVGATAGGVAGSAIGAGSGQLAAIAGGIALGGTIGYAVTPACRSKLEAYAPVATPVYK